MFGIRSIVVSTNIPLRRDGTPYRDGLNDRMTDPGVAVYFMRDDRQACLPCDTYLHPWENCRAIGRAVESFRRMKRDGADQILEQAFTGFMALPAPDSVVPWWQVLGVARDASSADVQAAWKVKARTAAGNEAAMLAINVTRDQGLDDAKARGV